MSAPPIVESENPGRTWRLRLEYRPDYARPDQVIAPVVDGNLALAAVLEPLTLVADIAYVDLDHGSHEGDPPRPSWCLEVDSPAAPERDWPEPETRVTVPAIDRVALESFLRTAADQPPSEGLSVCPVDIWMRAARALLPDPWSRGGDRVPVRYHGGTRELSVERDRRGAWVRGPDGYLLRPPVRTYGSVRGIHAELEIAAHWSPWYEEGAAGTAAIERAVAALEARGWRRS